MSTEKRQKNAATMNDLSRLDAAALVCASPTCEGAWQVEAAQANGGESLVAVFHGPQARALASEYAFAKYAAVLE